MRPWSLWRDVSTDHDHGESRPGSLGDRVQSALTEATGWVSAALPGDGGAGIEHGDGDGDAEAGHGSTGADDDGAGDGGVGEPGQPADPASTALETPEERVLRLVTENGGGMKQGDVVSAVEWSESTVSRKLSKLENDGAITRYRIGREKLVFLPGREPELLGSPWREVAADASGQA